MYILNIIILYIIIYNIPLKTNNDIGKSHLAGFLSQARNHSHVAGAVITVFEICPENQKTPEASARR